MEIICWKAGEYMDENSMNDKTKIEKQIDNYKRFYEDDFLVRIRNQNYQHKLCYCKVYETGRANLYMDGNANYEFAVPEELLEELKALAKNHVRNFVTKKHELTEDDRCYLPGYALDFGFKLWGYNDLNEYVDHTLYFEQESEFKIINELLAMEELDKFYLHE